MAVCSLNKTDKETGITNVKISILVFSATYVREKLVILKDTSILGSILDLNYN